MWTSRSRARRVWHARSARLRRPRPARRSLPSAATGPPPPPWPCGFRLPALRAMSTPVEFRCLGSNAWPLTGRGVLMGASLDDRRVRYLYESAVTGSVRAAADKIELNPSVVSRQIAKLEDELAIPLLERHGRGVKPTE